MNGLAPYYSDSFVIFEAVVVKKTLLSICQDSGVGVRVYHWHQVSSSDPLINPPVIINNYSVLWSSLDSFASSFININQVPSRVSAHPLNSICSRYSRPVIDQLFVVSLHTATMTRLSFLLAGSLTVLAGMANAGSAVVDLIPKNFDNVVLKSGKPALVEFFAPWCGHCKNLAPVYEELAQAFSFAEDKVTIAKVDADEHRDLGRKFGVQGFPTLKWFDGKSDKPEEYNGGRDLESLSAFVTQKTGIKPRGPKKEPSHVEMLTDSSFKSIIGSEKDVLVAFTAPWCGR